MIDTDGTVIPREDLPSFLRHAQWERFGGHVTVFSHGGRSYVRVLTHRGTATNPSWPHIAYIDRDEAVRAARFWESQYAF